MRFGFKEIAIFVLEGHKKQLASFQVKIPQQDLECVVILIFI